MSISEIQLKYKSETGESPIQSIEFSDMIEYIDAALLEGFTTDEILSYLKYQNPIPAALKPSFPKQFQKDEEIEIFTHEYVSWLEEFAIKFLNQKQ